MAQHDYNLVNQSGADFRADLNNALSAIATNNSGANQPSTTFAYEWWIDTTNNVIKLRNSANNAWITLPISITADNTVDINAGTVNGITSLSFSSGSTVTTILDEDNLTSDSATALATQQSIKAYVDSQVTAQDLDITDGSSAISIDLDSESLGLLGGTGVSTTASGNNVTFAIGQSVGTGDDVVFNQVTSSLVGNASTATSLATARAIALSGDVVGTANFDGSAGISISTTIQANSVALGTDTTGNYVATIAGTTNEIEVSGSGSETAAVTVGLPDNVVIAGNLTVNGTTTTVNTETLSVEDPLIKLANNNSSSDTVDIGFYGLYDTSGSQDLFAGLFRDANDSGKFKLFKDLQSEPTTTVNTSGTGYATGTLVADLEGNINSTLTSNLSFADNSKAIFGAGDDLQIYHNGSNSYIADVGTGDLRILASNFRLLNGAENANLIRAFDGAEVELYHNGTERLATTSTGVDVTGTVVADGLTVDSGTTNTVATFTSTDTGAGVQLTDPTGSSKLETSGANLRISVDDDGAVASSAIQFRVDGSTKATINSSGNFGIGTTSPAQTLHVNGNAFVSGQTFLGDASGDTVTLTGSLAHASDLTLDAGGDITLDADGGDVKLLDGGTQFGYIENSSTDLVLGVNTQDKDIIFKGNDGGSTINALKLDMSNNGRAIFNAGAGFFDHVNFSDNAKAVFGGGDDLQIYHDGTHSYVANGTNTLYLRTASSLQIENSDGSEDLATFAVNGAATLFHDNSYKLATTSSGINIDGGIDIKDGSSLNGTITSSSNSLTLNARNTGVLLFQSGGNEKARIDSSGRLGIGTSSPSEKLSISPDTDVSAEIGKAHIGSVGHSDYAGFAHVDKNTTSDYALLQGAAGDTFLNASDGQRIKFRINNSEKATIDSSGNLGIGTSSPSYKFDVYGEDDITMRIHRPNSGLAATDSCGIGFSQRGDSTTSVTDTRAGIFSNYNGDLFLAVESGGNLNSNPIDHAALFIEGVGGTVGIGTSSPQGNLHVEGAAGASGGGIIYVTDADNGSTASDALHISKSGDTAFVYNRESSGDLQLGAGNTAGHVVIKSSGNVGISTTSPSQKLHVDGIIASQNSSQGTGLLQLQGYGNTAYINHTGSSNLHFRMGSGFNTRMTLTNAGNLGVGTSSPSAVLEVVGPAARPTSLAELDTASTAKFTSDSSNNDSLYIAEADSGALIQANDGASNSSTAKNLQIQPFGGNIAIGTTTSPSSLLTVEGDIRQTNGDFLYSGGGNFDIKHLVDDQNIVFSTSTGGSTSEAMRIKGNGAIGIGTSSPSTSHRLTVSGDTKFTGQLSMSDNQLIKMGDSEDFAFYHDTSIGNVIKSSTSDMDISILGNDGGSSITALKFDMSQAGEADFNSAVKVAGGITAHQTDRGVLEYASNFFKIRSYGATAGSGSFVINVGGGGGSADSEALRLDSSGRLMIGTTSPDGMLRIDNAGQTTQSLITLKDSGGTGTHSQIQFNNTNGLVGQITTAGSATTYATSSDARLKDVTGTARGLEVINELNPVAYNWKADGKADEGLIAQEVKELVPNAVVGSEADMYSMDYSKLVVHLVAGMQEQQAIIEDLQTQLNKLKR